MLHSGTTKSLPGKLFLSFSAISNLKELYVESPSARQSTITCLHGFRAITTVWVAIAHIFYILPNFIENLDEFRSDISDNLSNLWISNSFLAVDIFLVLGGTVNAYGWLNKVRRLDVKPGWWSVGYWLQFYFHRALRVWPVYVHTLFMYTYFKRLHHHEVLPNDNPINQCSKFWWHNLLFINSLTGAGCAPHTWYMSAEYIFYMVSPVFLLAILKSTINALTLIVVTIVFSAGCTVYAMIAYNLSPTLLHWSKSPIFNASPLQHFIEIYIKPQYRIGPYLIGIFLGYLLSTNTRPTLLDSKLVRYVGNLIAIFCACYSFFGLYPILQGFNWPVYYLVFGALHRTVFALSVAWLIYICHTGLCPTLNVFFSNRLFFILAGLSYSFYMTHIPAIVAELFNWRFPFHYTGVSQVLMVFLTPFSLTVIYSTICVLICEYPAKNCIQIVKRRYFTKYQVL